MAHLRHHRAFHGRAEVGISKDDEWRITTQLHDGLQDPVGAATKQYSTDLGRARERHHAGGLVVDAGIEPLARTHRRNNVDDTGGHAGLDQQLTDTECR
ncbi:MAG: hypothetical protein R2706_11200 [Acidimicrobiales bacterium]